MSKYKEAIELIEKWSNEDSEYDKKALPEILEALNRKPTLRDVLSDEERELIVALFIKEMGVSMAIHKNEKFKNLIKKLEE